MTTSERRAATFAELGLRCETCGVPAVAMIQDFVRKSWPNTMMVEYERDGKPHLLCHIHERKPKIRDLTIDLP